MLCQRILIKQPVITFGVRTGPFICPEGKRRHDYYPLEVARERSGLDAVAQLSEAFCWLPHPSLTYE